MGIFPFINPEQVELASTSKELPLFQEYAYDFENNRLRIRDGKSYLVQGNDALRIWIYKALHTVRYAFMAYSRGYGTEVASLMGAPISEDILLPELQRFIVETLMANPYIKQLKDFVFAVEGAAVTVTFACVTVYGQMKELNYVYQGG